MIQADSVFSGISTFGRLQYHPCLTSDAVKYDIAFIGKPTVSLHLSLSLPTHEAHPSTPALPTVLVHVSVHRESGKEVAD